MGHIPADSDSGRRVGIPRLLENVKTTEMTTSCTLITIVSIKP